MTKQTKDTIKTMAGSWARAFVASVIAFYLATGSTSLKALAGAGLASVLPPIYRYLNPKDSLGR
jgi:hypothetical protein